MDAEACIHIRHIFVSKEQLELSVGIVDDESLRKVDFKTPLTIKIQSRAVTKINGEPLKLKKNQDPYVLDYTSQDRLLIAFKEENLIRIELEWIPLNISFSKRTPTHDEKYLIPEIESMARKGVDLRMSENALEGTHFVATDSALDIPLIISLIRNIPLLNSRWIEEASSSPENLSKWFFEPERGNLTLDLDRYSSSKEERNNLFRGCLFVTISDYNEIHNDLVSLFSLIGGSLVTVSQISNLNMENKHNDTLRFLHNYLESTSSSQLYLLKEETNDSSRWSSHFLDQGLPVSSIEDLFRAIVANDSSMIRRVDFSNIRSDDIVEQPRKRRKFQKVDKTKFLDFGFNIPSETRAVNDIQSTGNNNRSNNEKITNSPSMENDKDIEDTESKPSERKTESPATKDDSREVPDDDPKHASDETIIDKPVDKSSTSFSDNSTNKENRLSKVTMSDAIKTIKEKETSNIRDKLGLSEIKDDLSYQVNDLSLVEYIDMNRKPIHHLSSPKHMSDKYEGRKNVKTFRKVKPSYLMSKMKPTKVGLKAFDSDDNDLHNAEMQKFSEEDPSLQMAIDFGDASAASATQGIPVHSKSKESAPMEMGNQEDVLFVPDDSQDGGTFNSFVVNQSKSPSHSTYQDGRNKGFLRENFGNNTNYIDDDNDDADDDEPKFSFKRS
ncbi:Piso0_001739 [Millerozyma farinosa CBS 7064]|uniref:Piso0_001739 protein n=1 Tax=Pichia sorbitophila (strain ATCC MYA-4447 / BCRC 22081 / CBS 7064 / NBRC 10061 / NRRL Y-12695) TaxID=559304 RepID=G8YNY9_PICSO|nr:Piso0_001739 [Millerozyma farinosa CBS 7064]